MKTYVALLRGINVGGHRKVPMAELRKLLSDSGLQNVRTYIQSGNIVFRSTEERKTILEGLIQKAIYGHFGFEVSVFIITFEDIKHILEACPFSEEKRKKGYFMLLQRVPKKHLIDETHAITYPNEEFHITSKCVYYYSSAGYGNAKCNNNFFERKLKVQATARNYNTMVKLLSLCAEN